MALDLLYSVHVIPKTSKSYFVVQRTKLNVKFLGQNLTTQVQNTKEIVNKTNTIPVNSYENKKGEDF